MRENRWSIDLAEVYILRRQTELARASYEQLRSHNEQVMFLRHDMINHLKVLLEKIGDYVPEALSYVDELIGKNEKITDVVHSGNEILDIIMNGKLAEASRAGIHVQLVRAKAPEKLPLSDTDTCSLLMNILDNAINGAVNSGQEQPWIRIDFHIKDNYFVLTCKNSSTLSSHIVRAKPEERHGLGLKIIRQIMSRFGDLMDVEQEEGSYRIAIAIPLENLECQ